MAAWLQYSQFSAVTITQKQQLIFLPIPIFYEAGNSTRTNKERVTHQEVFSNHRRNSYVFFNRCLLFSIKKFSSQCIICFS